MSEIVVSQDAVAAQRDAIDSMEALRANRRRIGREDAILHNEGAVVERDVLDNRSRRPCAVVDENNRVVDVHLRVVAANSGPVASFEIHVS